MPQGPSTLRQVGQPLTPPIPPRYLIDLVRPSAPPPAPPVRPSAFPGERALIGAPQGPSISARPEWGRDAMGNPIRQRDLDAQYRLMDWTRQGIGRLTEPLGLTHIGQDQASFGEPDSPQKRQRAMTEMMGGILGPEVEASRLPFKPGKDPRDFLDRMTDWMNAHAAATSFRFGDDPMWQRMSQTFRGLAHKYGLAVPDLVLRELARQIRGPVKVSQFRKLLRKSFDYYDEAPVNRAGDLAHEEFADELLTNLTGGNDQTKHDEYLRDLRDLLTRRGVDWGAD